jgi:multiple sugar transport system permease protein
MSAAAEMPTGVYVKRPSILRTRTVRITRRALNYLLLSAVSLVTIFPFIWMISTSMKTQGALFAIPPQLLPDTLGTPEMWSNYVEVLTRHNFIRYTGNSFIVATGAALGQIFTSSLAGFAFARMQFFGKNVIFGTLLATAIIPIEVSIIPEFLMGVRIFDPLLRAVGGWMDTFAPLIIPSFMVGTVGTFLMREFFSGIPIELEEAAVIDGAKVFQIYRHIYLPLSAPALTTLFLLAFINNWNALLRPLIYITSPDLRTLPMGLVRFQGMYDTQWNLLLAGSVIAIVPLVVIYIFMQRYIVEGIATTGLKG